MEVFVPPGQQKNDDAVVGKLDLGFGFLGDEQVVDKLLIAQPSGLGPRRVPIRPCISGVKCLGIQDFFFRRGFS